MKQGESYIKTNVDFLQQLWTEDAIPKGATADAGGLYPSIPR